MRLVACLILIVLSTSGCGLMTPPKVEVKNAGGGAATVDNLPSPTTLGVSELCDDAEAGQCGNVGIALKQEGAEDRWAYWRAGAENMVYRPDPSYVESDRWDMRVTKYFPLVGSNGGKTAEDEGFQAGLAAFAVLPDFSPSPRRAADVAGLSFVSDKFEGLEYEGTRLAPEYQNPVVNTIGPGLLKGYSMRDHSVQLSYRIFILKTVDSSAYYAIRFYFYSRAANIAAFQWKRLL